MIYVTGTNCNDDFIVVMSRQEFNKFLKWRIYANMDNDDSEED